MRKLILVAGLAAAALVPSMAFAQSCEQQHDSQVGATFAGAGIGALVGATIAPRRDQGAGALIGAGAGAVIGGAAGGGGGAAVGALAGGAAGAATGYATTPPPRQYSPPPPPPGY